MSQMERPPKPQGSFRDSINKQQSQQNAEIRRVIIAATFFVLLFGLTIVKGLMIHSPFQETHSIHIDGPNICVEDIPAYEGQVYVVINNDIPNLLEEVIDPNEEFEYYSDLDSLGRCGAAFANICSALMPTNEREKISSIYPSGWSNQKYEGIEQEYLYNRCHLIAFQLAGESANERNLITGTRYFNVSGMLPFETKVMQYVEKTGNHVLYRVTPIFKDNELVARGVLMEAQSVEDRGDGVCFYVFIYNIQPGIEINYKDGTSYAG